MFLIRTAFWLSLVILFIPTGESNAPDAGPVDSNMQLSAIEALSAAQDTVSDLAGFCQRNADTCETGSAALKVFGQKAQYGARKIYEYIAEANSQTSPSADPAALARDSIDTLLQADKDIPWQGTGTQG
jgi:Family of unknown function (DUF5330)